MITMDNIQNTVLSKDSSFPGAISGPRYNGNIVFREHSNPHFLNKHILTLDMWVIMKLIGEFEVDGQIGYIIVYIFDKYPDEQTNNTNWYAGVRFPDEDIMAVNDCVFVKNDMPVKGVFDG